jgi:thiol-disulfide isomerase/thioredoxin
MYKSYDQLGEEPVKNRDVFDVFEIKSLSDKHTIIGNNEVVCLEIYADWCGPCKHISPTYSILAANYSKPGQCAVVKYKYEDLDPSEKKDINGIPIFNFYYRGQLRDQVIGADMDAVENKLKKLLQFANSQNQVSVAGPPIMTRNNIRNNKTEMPNMDPSNGIPYNQNNGGYHMY